MENLGKLTQIFFEKQFEIKLNPKSIKEIQGGFLSRAFVLEIEKNGIQEKLFLRTIKSREGGYGYNIDRLKAFVLSHEMYTNADLDIISYGIMAVKNNELVYNIEVNNEVEFYHIQSFKEGISYMKYIEEFNNKTKLEKLDLDILKKIAQKIALVHTKPINNIQNQENLYQKGYQEVITNPEITFDILSCFPENHPFFGTCQFRYDYISKMMIQYDKYRLNSKKRKLSYLHGDFWEANILIDPQNNPFFIDFSRIPYGDAGIDIGWFVGNLLIKKIITNNPIYIEAAKYFIEEYIKETGDKDILEYTLLSFFWLGIVNLFPPIFGDKDIKYRDLIIEKIMNDFKKGTMILA